MNRLWVTAPGACRITRHSVFVHMMRCVHALMLAVALLPIAWPIRGLKAEEHKPPKKEPADAPQIVPNSVSYMGISQVGWAMS